MAPSWNNELEAGLITQYGKKKGTDLAKKYAQAFSRNYLDEYTLKDALADISHIELLSDQHPLEIQFYFSSEKSEYPLHLRLYQWQKPIPLSDVLPMLENFDLRTYNERPTKIVLSKEHEVWISDFAVTYAHATIDVDIITDVFEEAFTKIYLGVQENDGFNKLVLGASLSWREIVVLRAYAKYLQQVGFRFSQAYIEKALVNNPGIAKKLVDYFIAKHSPKTATHAIQAIEKIEQSILQSLDTVSSLDEDRIIRRLLDLLKATLRVNYFQTGDDGKPKDYLSFKLLSEAIPELPLPVPLYEIFVYSARFEAIHLRSAKVARGGIRWSDRPQDFRTEVLGLMKAQKVKNAVIVPSGAKGGFVLKAPLIGASRETLKAEVVQCYQSFIRGLLDLTDNIDNGNIIRPKNVVCYDDVDTYLVVAADKGTATFSDIANSISKDYHFWLGDAFASGGKTGYDHKKIGITARGAWESIKRHFRELDIEATTAPITVVGIGDMSGDVFGNGALYSKHIRLIAAFDHRNIFIDPDPDPIIAYNERNRLFHLPTSSWEDYDPKLISKGGGVFKRSAKSISLSAQAKKILGIESAALSPNELVQAVLRAPVDLLFNGGIGTYVKASTESNLDVGDRTNDYCRINGNELRCRVVGEGGNLGFTQLGRVEYALKGGLINTDFIDNSGGVDCSDHEVNLKILLDQEVRKHKLTEKQRDALLASVTNEVADLVLQDNYYQALVMSFSAFHSEQNIGLHQNYIKDLEALGVLKRKVEFLPDDKQLMERKASSIGLTRPELAVLLAYTKIYIKQEILKSDWEEGPYLSLLLGSAFPESIRKKYKEAMSHHPMRRNIIATQISNLLVNEMGITFVYRIQMETGASVAEIVRAYAVASEVFSSRELKSVIEALNFKIPMAEQYSMLFNLRHLVSLATRWFLYSRHMKEDLQQVVQHFSKNVKLLEKVIPNLMAGFTKEYLDNLKKDFIKAGLSKETAQRIATYRAIYTTLNIIEVATKYHFDLIKTASVYFAAGERMHMVWFRDQIAKDTRDGHWNTLARLTLRDELDIAQRTLTVAIIQNDKKENNTEKLINHWITANQRAVDRWNKLLALLVSNATVDYTTFFIAMRELLGLVIASQPETN